jgi:general secretion pathway protein J
MTRAGSQAGMTLLELIVAMAIFALVATAGYTALQQGIQVQERLQASRTFWQRLDTVMGLMATDLGQARDLAPRGSTRAWSRAFQGREVPGSGGEGRLFRLIRGGHTAFRDGPISPYLRVAYRVRETTLYRVSWPRLDAPDGLEGREVALMGGIQRVSARYLGGGNQWTDRWPPPAGGQADFPALPRAVEVSLRFEDHGTFRRRFHVGAPH